MVDIVTIILGWLMIIAGWIIVLCFICYALMITSKKIFGEKRTTAFFKKIEKIVRGILD